MNRKILAAGFVAIAFSFTLSFSENSYCTHQYPPQKPDAIRTIIILVLSTMYHAFLPDIMRDSPKDTGFMPDDFRMDLFLWARSFNDMLAGCRV